MSRSVRVKGKEVRMGGRKGGNKNQERKMYRIGRERGR